MNVIFIYNQYLELIKVLYGKHFDKKYVVATEPINLGCHVVPWRCWRISFCLTPLCVIAQRKAKTAHACPPLHGFKTTGYWYHLFVRNVLWNFDVLWSFGNVQNRVENNVLSISAKSSLFILCRLFKWAMITKLLFLKDFPNMVMHQVCIYTK